MLGLEHALVILVLLVVLWVYRKQILSPSLVTKLDTAVGVKEGYGSYDPSSPTNPWSYAYVKEDPKAEGMCGSEHMDVGNQQSKYTNKDRVPTDDDQYPYLVRSDKEVSAGYETLNSVNDYNEYLDRVGLDSHVKANHKQFQDDINRLTIGASNQTLFEPVDMVPWVGLRRTKYADAYVGSEARSVPGETQSNLPPVNTTFTIGNHVDIDAIPRGFGN